jgi:hypothetical protein
VVFQPIRHVDAVVTDELGRNHRAVVVGLPRGDGHWDGYIEFRDDEGGVLVTPCETTQAGAADLFGWATELSSGDLQRALERATEQEPELCWWPRPEGQA